MKCDFCSKEAICFGYLPNLNLFGLAFSGEKTQRMMCEEHRDKAVKEHGIRTYKLEEH